MTSEMKFILDELLLLRMTGDFEGDRCRTIDAIVECLEIINSKADMYDKKETPYIPTDLNLVDYYINSGDCICENPVYQTQIYCNRCGQKLDWRK